MTLELRVSCLSPPRLEQALGRDDRREMRLAISGLMREGKKSLSPTLRSPNGCQVCRQQHGAQRFHGDRPCLSHLPFSVLAPQALTESHRYAPLIGCVNVILDNALTRTPLASCPCSCSSFFLTTIENNLNNFMYNFLERMRANSPA